MIDMHRAILSITFLLAAGFIAFTPAVAEATAEVVMVNSSPAFPVVIDGEQVTSFPAAAQPGSTVCVLNNPTYLNEMDRHTFNGWSHDSAEECVTLEQPGEYTAMYSREILLQSRSQAKAMRTSSWVPKGAPVALRVPPVVEDGPGVRYLFEEWTNGETPFSPDNIIVPNRPLTLEVRWKKQLYVDLKGPEGVELVGAGWHDSDEQVVLMAPPTVFSPGEDQKLHFKGWEVESRPALIVPNNQSAVTSVQITAPVTIRAEYDIGYLVEVENPKGTLIREWYPQGRQLPIDTAQVLDVSPNRERLNFIRWEGIDLSSQKGTITVEGPLRVQAVYDREYMLNIQSP